MSCHASRPSGSSVSGLSCAHPSSSQVKSRVASPEVMSRARLQRSRLAPHLQGSGLSGVFSWPSESCGCSVATSCPAPEATRRPLSDLVTSWLLHGGSAAACRLSCRTAVTQTRHATATVRSQLKPRHAYRTPRDNHFAKACCRPTTTQRPVEVALPRAIRIPPASVRRANHIELAYHVTHQPRYGSACTVAKTCWVSPHSSRHLLAQPTQ